ncbi:MAG: hypothetical protein ACK40X_07780 [Armatimonadota bacterium]
MKARFVVKFYHEPAEASRFAALVELYLPTETENIARLHPTLQSSTVSVFDELLMPQWGSYDANERARWNRKRVRAGSWEELQTKVQEVISEAVATLKRVKEQNEEETRSMPQPYTYEVEL